MGLIPCIIFHGSVRSDRFIPLASLPTPARTGYLLERYHVYRVVCEPVSSILMARDCIGTIRCSMGNISLDQFVDESSNEQDGCHEVRYDSKPYTNSAVTEVDL